MSIPTLYIKGSKKFANEVLAAGGAVAGLQHTIFEISRHNLADMPDGTVIKFYDKIIQGNPVAKSYGNWRPAKNRIV